MKKILPPALAEWILAKSLSHNIRYGAMGDFEYIFSEIAESRGPLAAKAWYWKQLAISLPHLVLDTLIWATVMLKNYLLVAYRNLYKNKAASLVNILGLSVAVAVAVTGYLFIERQYTMDGFHENGANLFLVENYVSQGQDIEHRGDTPMPLGPAMQADLPMVKRAVRVAYGHPTIKVGDNTFQESVWMVDSEFQDVFSFRLRLGDKSVPVGIDDVILSDAMAIKYFGDENPLGKQMEFIFSDDTPRMFTVRGVAHPFPNKTSFSFNALIHFDHLQILGVDEEDWAETTGATFIEVTSPEDIPSIAGQMNAYASIQNSANEKRPVTEFVFANIGDLSTQSYAVTGDISGGSHPAGSIVLGLVALFMLALSCINYMNMAIVTASKRLKEIGIRKAVGGSKSQLVMQFLAENIVVCLVALTLGVAIAYFFFVPGFNSLFEWNDAGIKFVDAGIGNLLLFLTVLLIVTGVVSGSYPAFYISSFQPDAIFRNSTTLGGESNLTRGLLSFQFVLAFLTMIMGVVMAQNSDYQAAIDWGYSNELMYVVRADNQEDFRNLKSEIEQIAGVEQVVGATHHFSRSWMKPTVDVGTDRLAPVQFDIGDGFLEMYGLKLMSGKAFTSSSRTSVDGGILINQLFADTRSWSLEEAIGKTIRADSTQYTVAGVVNNFVYDTIYDPIVPAILLSVPEEAHRFLSIRIAAGSSGQTEEAIRAIWKTVVPDREYTGFFQDQVYESIFRENTNIKKVFTFIAILALFVACMGLFGLTAQKIASRMKEISVRKVLGASIPHLTKKMNTSFLIIVSISAVLAMPIGYFAMTGLLGSIYADPMPIGPSSFILSFTFVLITAMLTISTQIRKISSANPADVLRNQ
jgi:putative ABC transport system permease protein